MATMLYKTKGNASPKDKPRVFFTCHPADFQRYFEKICEDIFLTHDCAIYYTEDPNEPIPEQALETDLGSNNLFVIPVTFKLLTQPNRAMDQDFAYARQFHIPVLPIMMESGLDELYSKPEKFDTLQYLEPYVADLTEIPYSEKLKNYLESVLISDETVQRIREAFDAYVFLSYRKKDRYFANQLMRMIHRIPQYRDIAIWYDEFLTPGESFRESIDAILHSSKLFTLLVTPNLLEEPEGKPNFVMAEEYPAARASGIDIFPVEMVPTDKEALGQKYPDLPECVDVGDESAFHNALRNTLGRVALAANDADPEHTYLIGLAYLDGIDVEVDRERGLELLTAAAESGFYDAMEKLYFLYESGSHVPLDYRKAAYWMEKIIAYAIREYGEDHEDTLTAMNNAIPLCLKLGNLQEARERQETVYARAREVLGPEHPKTNEFLVNLVAVYLQLGEYPRALELCEHAYQRHLEAGDAANLNAASFLSNLAICHIRMGDYPKALEILKQQYTDQCQLLGEEHPSVLTLLNNLTIIHSKTGDLQTALTLSKKAYALYCKTLGAEHPNTLTSMCNLARAYLEMGLYHR